jgi:formylglycine-generating enzyme required for sulfatase activity
MKDLIPPSQSTQFADEVRTPGACFSDGPLLPEMVVVPPGKFWMAGNGEKTRHWVQIAYPVAISRYPVTFEQWDACAEGDPEVHRPDDQGLGRGRRSVVNVSWEDAEHYVGWLSLAAGRSYRLLSEAEWEYCSRAGDVEIISPGDQVILPESNFPRRDSHDRPASGRPIPPVNFGPNPFGLFEMDGTLDELVADAWHETLDGAPSDGSAWEHNQSTMWRVVRAGKSDSSPKILPRPIRDSIHHLKRTDRMGFRVACRL